MDVRTRRAVFTILFVFLFFSAQGVIDTYPVHACDLPVQSRPYDAGQLEKGRITVDLATIFTQQDITKIETSANTCRVSISQKIQQFQYEISNLLQYKANLQGYANIRDMIKRLETLKREKKNIYDTIGRDFSQISFRGIYGTILEMTPGTNRKALIMAARRLIAPRAIHDLRGVAVSAVSVASSSQVVFDRIVAETAGEMDIETPVLEERKFFKGKTQLLYVAVVSVKPLKGAVQKVGGTDKVVASSVVDILMPEGTQRYKNNLANITGLSYAEGQGDKLEKIVAQWAGVIRNGNGMAVERERSILMDLDRKLADKDDQIRSAYGMVARSRANLARLYRNIGFTECQGDAEGCLSRANQYIDDKIEKLVDRSLAEKEKELVFRKDRIRGEGDPAQEILDLAGDLCKNLKTTYGQREQFIRLSVAESGVLVKDVEDQGYYIQRHPRQGWIYPYADDRGDLWLLVAMNFRVERGGRSGDGGGSKTFVNSIGQKFVPIPKGTFMMGSHESATSVAGNSIYIDKSGKPEWYKREHPLHKVTLTMPFYMQSTEVTVGQWRSFIDGTRYRTEAETGGGAYIWTGKWEKKEGYYWDKPGFSQTDRHPVTCISWNDAQKFIRWLNRKEETDKYCLPTEAQWEYACRAGSVTPFYWGRRPSETHANFADSRYSREFSSDEYVNRGFNDGYVYTAPVGSLRPNDWGLYDMSGNVGEWCEDWYGDYTAGDITEPKGSTSGSDRVLRGGSWNNPVGYVRSALRRGNSPDIRHHGMGFRVARAH